MIAITRSTNGLFRDLTGQRFCRWAVLGRSQETDCLKTMWRCRCECGTVRDVVGKSLTRGISKSCGCYGREVASATTIKRCKTHGMSRTRAFSIWSGMLGRCLNVTNENYPQYGGRGIKVCDRWAKSFAAFFEDMGPPPCKHTIDRIDNDGHYEPSNCRWATSTEQNRNRNSYNRVIEHAGRSATVAEWVEITGLTYTAIWQRLGRGWPIEKVLTTPRRLRKRRT